MKAIVVLILGLSSSLTMANYSCDITEVGNTQLTKEYTNDYDLGVEGGTYSLNGQLNTNISVEKDGFLTDIEIDNRTFDYSTSTIKENDDMFTAKIIDKKKTNELLLKIYKKSKLGVLLGKNQGTSKYKMLAIFDCNDYSKEMKIILNADIDRLKRTNFNKISKDTLNVMNSVDLSFEKGDGYYSVIKEKVYAVKGKRKVIGYIIESELSYTEGENEFSTNYYLANGIRIGSDLWNY